MKPVVCPGCLYSGQPHLTSCKALPGFAEINAPQPGSEADTLYTPPKPSISATISALIENRVSKAVFVLGQKPLYALSSSGYDMTFINRNRKQTLDNFDLEAEELQKTLDTLLGEK